MERRDDDELINLLRYKTESISKAFDNSSVAQSGLRRQKRKKTGVKHSLSAKARNQRRSSPFSHLNFLETEKLRPFRRKTSQDPSRSIVTMDVDIVTKVRVIAFRSLKQ